MENSASTIAAVSTAYGESGIGIVRMSGPMAFSIGKRIFVRPEKVGHGDDSAAGGFSPKPRYMYYGHIKDPESGKLLDEVLCVFMKSPHTYTGEDLVEIQCHGSVTALKNILSLCLKSGAAAAGPGEFSKRAFLNGRLDLSQAEAVIDLIKARTEKSFDIALDRLGGSLSAKVRSIREKLLEILARLAVDMDFPDEDIEEEDRELFKKKLSSIDDELLKMLATSGEGRILREGLGVAIVGRPNVGKSSLLNALLRTDRSIVTDIPGTTRDTVEESASIGGIPIKLTDTAGIHSSDDPVEALGIERSKEAFNKADLIILVIDSSEVLTASDDELLTLLSGRPAVIMLNKRDKEQLVFEEDLRKKAPGVAIISAAVKNGEGIKELCDMVEEMIQGGAVQRKEPVLLSNVRHIDCVRRAHEELGEALLMTGRGEALDFIEINVHAAYDALGEITGETAGDEIIEKAFAEFCVGK